MGRKILYLAKVSLFTVRYLICPLVVVFGIMFSILVIPIISSQSINYLPLILISLAYGWIFASPIFFLKIAFSVSKRFERKADSLENRLSKKFKISIRTRIDLKKYFGVLSFSMFLVCLVLFIRYFVTHSNAPP